MSESHKWPVLILEVTITQHLRIPWAASHNFGSIPYPMADTQEVGIILEVSAIPTCQNPEWPVIILDESPIPTWQNSLSDQS